MNKINEQCNNDIEEEFNRIRTNLQIHIERNEDIDQMKAFLSSYIPKEVLSSSEVIFDTAINYLMDNAKLRLKETSAQLQNSFYEYDFRKSIRDWVDQIENKLALEPDVVTFSSDPRFLQGLTAGGVTLFAGSAITVAMFNPTKYFASIVSGLLTLFLSTAAFKVTYEKATSRAIAQMSSDIENYLLISKDQVTEWLNKVLESFEKDFQSFCIKNGLEV